MKSLHFHLNMLNIFLGCIIEFTKLIIIIIKQINLIDGPDYQWDNSNIDTTFNNQNSLTNWETTLTIKQIFHADRQH